MSSKHSREIWVLKWTRKKINFVYFQLGYYNLGLGLGRDLSFFYLSFFLEFLV